MRLGFIGQGYVGKNTADYFASHRYDVVRYSLEHDYIHNKDKIRTCDVVFIAVPTPTTPEGFDYHIVEVSLTLVQKGKTAVIKSTLIPGTTQKLQKQFPDIIILVSPEFLCEATAAHDAVHPIFNIIGLPSQTNEHAQAAKTIMEILPRSTHSFIISASAAELFKYTHNIHGYMRVVFVRVRGLDALRQSSGRLGAWPMPTQ